MVFESGDSSFGRIAPVEVWGYKLVVDLVGCHELFQLAWCFVVQALEDWFESAIGEISM